MPCRTSCSTRQFDTPPLPSGVEELFARPLTPSLPRTKQVRQAARSLGKSGKQAEGYICSSCSPVHWSVCCSKAQAELCFAVKETPPVTFSCAARDVGLSTPAFRVSECGTEAERKLA